MHYTVSWLPGAESELARLWLEETLRGNIELAANEIDLCLRVDPENAGESREGNRRILFVTPLVVTFKVDRQDRMVQVREVWLYGRTS